jgi:hypothetical protein
MFAKSRFEHLKLIKTADGHPAEFLVFNSIHWKSYEFKNKNKLGTYKKNLHGGGKVRILIAASNQLKIRHVKVKSTFLLNQCIF